MAEKTTHSRRRGRRMLAGLQGGYYLITGVWPFIDIGSFMALTGPKTDIWLVHTVGALVAVVGLVLLLAVFRPAIRFEVMVLAVGAALALTGIEVFYVANGTISWVYLLDAVAEIALVAGWLAVGRSPAEAR